MRFENSKRVRFSAVMLHFFDSMSLHFGLIPQPKLTVIDFPSVSMLYFHRKTLKQITANIKAKYIIIQKSSARSLVFQEYDRSFVV